MSRAKSTDKARNSLPDLSHTQAVIYSLEGRVLSARERDFFREAGPLGFILFARNCETPEQIRKLTGDLRESVGRACPILIDQEGGRVQRLRPPMWGGYPAMQTFGAVAERDMEEALEKLRFVILQMAQELRECGINVNCAPVLDVLRAETHEAIGDRAFSEDPAIVARLGLCVCRNLLAAGIQPVIKHLPGHGRATSDSHKDLPLVAEKLGELDKTDFEPFCIVSKSDVGQAIWGMAAHVVYKDIDPDHPASVSSKVIQKIIREIIGFEGLLLSDDLDMQALEAYGDVAARAGASLKAGCDVALYCGGKLDAMEKIAKNVPKLTANALKRLQNSQEFPKVAA